MRGGSAQKKDWCEVKAFRHVRYSHVMVVCEKKIFRLSAASRSVADLIMVYNNPRREEPIHTGISLIKGAVMGQGAQGALAGDPVGAAR